MSRSFRWTVSEPPSSEDLDLYPATTRRTSHTTPTPSIMKSRLTTTATKIKKYQPPAGNAGDPSTLKQMGARPYTVGTYLNSSSRADSFKEYFDKEAQKSVTNHVNKKYHLKDAYDIYKSQPAMLAGTSPVLKAGEALDGSHKIAEGKH